MTGKPVGIKSVIGGYQSIDDLCRAIKKRGPESAPDFITIDSADGGVIAHSCGVREPRSLRRAHARIVIQAEASVPLDEFYEESRSLRKLMVRIEAESRG